MIGFDEYKEILYQFKEIILESLNGSFISLVLYGSVARGKAKKFSDIDLLLIQDNAPPSYYQRLQPVLEAVKKLKETADYIKLKNAGGYGSFKSTHRYLRSLL